ncbi:flagellar protein FliT [Oceanobacillus piezotolerans]|uniref:Flagellar protein FliT n=1 Tax=Oceanobacillus piezotolerans TaxID=2448030 RepID=A0A498DJL1_9BACI|nr:flagellar protein FliT [Oceanobacillus piezotolerans]RLL46652.1 flagellar protein FliT [Oceanobacillus piezotolerans]
MNRIKPIFELTKQMKAILDQTMTAKNREEMINKVNNLLEQRGMEMESINPPYTEDEKQLGKELLHLNEGVQRQIEAAFLELKKEMKQVKRQKASNKKYLNPYQNVQIMDGRYLDKKK